MPEKPIYVPKCNAKEFKFRDGGSIIKISMQASTFAEWAKQNQNDAGYINLVVSARRETGKFGETHSVTLDTWKPDPNRQRSANPPANSPAPTSTDGPPPEEDDVPF